MPFEIGKLAGEFVDVHRRLREYTPLQQLVEDPELEVGSEFGIQGRRSQSFVLKLSEPYSESGEGGLPQFRERLFKSSINCVRFAEHDARGVAVSREKLQPASEARLEDSTRAASPCGGCRGIERFERLLGAFVKIVEDREEQLLFAVEIQVERATRDTGPPDDVRDTRPAISLPRKDPRGRVQQLPAPDISRKDCSSPPNLI